MGKDLSGQRFVQIRVPGHSVFIYLRSDMQHQKSDFRIIVHGTNFLASGRTKFSNTHISLSQNLSQNISAFVHEKK